MGRPRQAAATDGTVPVDNVKLLEQEQAKEQRHRERAGELVRLRQEKQGQLAEKNTAIRKSIDEVVGGLPESDSSDLVAKILNLKSADRSQLIEDVDKLGIALEAENRLATAARLKAKELEGLIEDEAKDAAAVEMHAAVLKWLEKYKTCDGQRLRLFEQAARCGFRDFAARMQRLGLKGGIVAGALCESYLSRPERRDELTVSGWRQAVRDLGKAYGVRCWARWSGCTGLRMSDAARELSIRGYGRPEQTRPAVTTTKKK